MSLLLPLEILLYQIGKSGIARLRLAGICIMISITSAAVGDENILRERFLKQYQPHAKLLEDSYTNIYVKYHFFKDGNNGKSDGWYLDGKYNRLNFFVEGVHATLDNKTNRVISRSNVKSISCRNALYSFDLVSGDNGQYVLSKLDVYEAANTTDLGMLNVPYADVIRKKTYLEIAQDKATQIIGLEDHIWQNKMRWVLKTKFVHIHQQSKKPLEVIVEYYFSPEDTWVCCGKRWYAADGSESKGIEERYYYEAKEGDQLSKLKRLESWLINLRDSSTSELSLTTEISEFRRSSIPFLDSDFKLSAFGLPEPMGIKQPESSRTWLWLLAAAIVAAALAIMFAWLKCRHTRTASAPQRPPEFRRLP